MPLTGEAKADNQRRYRGEKAAEKKAFEAFAEQDEAGTRHLSEVLSYQDLCNLFYGVKPELELEEEDEKKEAKRKHRKKSIVKPSGKKIVGEERTFEEWLELRDKARKDLFWLGRDVLKKDLLPHVHQVVCDQFVQKNFDGAFPKGYTLGNVHRAIDRQVRKDIHGEDTKEMMLLDPRGFYKTTINCIDCVQWIINVPDIRILILSGEYKLAQSFMSGIKNCFSLPEGAEETDFHLLFPEYIVRGVDSTSMQPIECPARRHFQKEASLWVNSIGANLSGWHCDVRKTDDVVTDENCNNVETRQALKEKVDGTDNLLDQWGFSDFIGTRYWVDDFYGTRLHPDEDGSVVPIKYHCRACWVVKPEYIEVPLKKLEEHMVVLTFPEKASFKSLRRTLIKNERSFRNQQLNEPTAADEDSSYKVTFLEDILRTHMYQASAAPREGDIFVCWDWAPSAGKYSDLSVGAAGRIYRKIVKNEILQREEIVYGIAILEIIYDRWKPSELAYQIVNFNKKWAPKQTLIEKSTGAELLQLQVQQNAMKYGVSLNIYWKPVNQAPDAKRNRIKNLEVLLKDGRLWFVSGPWIDETFGQLIRYTGERKNKGRKDDIPDCISFFSFFLPSTESSEDKRKMEEAMRIEQQRREQYQRLFGGGQVQQQTVEIEQPKPDDPRMKIFGGNGLRV